MNQNKIEAIKNLLEGISKTVDAKISFSEQIKYISEKLVKTAELLGIEVDINNPEVNVLIKSAAIVEEEKPIVFDDKGYKPWLEDARKDIKWNFYDRYEKYLYREKHWNKGTIMSINQVTDIILDHMRNPKTDNHFGVKGLVMGDIQSGKTANYTALINKAIDAGYKLVIILAGMTKDLRSQTQKRLDKEVLGYETRVDFKKGTIIGVGKIDEKNDYFINAITHSGDVGDLKKITAESISTSLNKNMQPLVAVLKKNSSVLKALNENFLSADIHSRTNGKLDIPVLIIDDEVDQASVNTKQTIELSDASTINKLLRIMLSKLNRYAYVGYTATPFANVFINPYGFDNEDEKDIFPEDFIICLPRPNGYCGVEEYFGFDTISDDDTDAINLDLYKPISDYEDLFDKDLGNVKVDTQVMKINSTLNDALMHFIIASAIKKSRNIMEHNSMLIHIARYKNPSTSMRDLVKDTISSMRMNYKYEEETRENYKKYWEENIKPTSQSRLGDHFNDSWEEIQKHIVSVFDSTINGIKIINGDSSDVCDYDKSNEGQHIIIGGDKLSRGLTLEGLIVSYYYRKTKTYDALLQMGRWFGYRNGWIDLCRIYTTNEFVNDFINAGIATESFKKDIAEMNLQKLSPSEFGLKVQYSPRLAPTSNSKMRTAKKQKISFSGSVQQLLSFKKKYTKHNREITNEYINKLENAQIRKNGNIVFKNVSSSWIIDYLKSYKECDELTGYVSIKNWIKYIEKLNEVNELTNWTVVIHSNKKEGDKDLIGKYEIVKMRRTDRQYDVKDNNENIALKVIIDPTDFVDFYDPSIDEYRELKSYSPENQFIKSTFTKENGVISIYVCDIHRKEIDVEKSKRDENGNIIKRCYKKGEMLPGGEGIIGLAVWFSQSENYINSAVDYYVNQVYLNKNDGTLDENEDGE